jgi:hypothetical protein
LSNLQSNLGLLKSFLFQGADLVRLISAGLSGM